MLSGKVVRIRWVKYYPTAHNHVAVGDMITVITRAITVRPE